ncbi:hypothetical protein KUW15_03995 [Qipengyuania aquimaris]|uniref:hypothetical protein n=1 Tax=Qipengyuania aquimaris TaxID=255984 RepID=UPI001C9587EF|nr:hypothetical protein [Qipengyuania aquimaris]MBY6127872.1 hypothetical protein [Qipengyuania aquimaris]
MKFLSEEWVGISLWLMALSATAFIFYGVRALERISDTLERMNARDKDRRYTERKTERDASDGPF